MTPDDIARVQSSFSKVVPIKEAAAELFYGRLFDIAPEVRPMFKGDIKEQGRKLMFYSNLAPMPLRREAAEALTAFASNGHKQVFFCNSGGEANENALKIAIKATGRSRIVSFRGSFHGRTLLAMGATDNQKWHKWFPGWIGEVARIIPNNLAGLSEINEINKNTNH